MLLHLDMCFTKMLKARNKHSFSEVIFNLCWDFYSRPKHTFFSFEILAYLKCSMLVLMKVPRGRKNRYNFPHLAWKKMSASLFHDYYATISIYIDCKHIVAFISYFISTLKLRDNWEKFRIIIYTQIIWIHRSILIYSREAIKNIEKLINIRMNFKLSEINYLSAKFASFTTRRL